MKIMMGSILSVLLGMSFANAAAAGGWSVVTLDEVPQAAVASEPFPIGLTLRAHGRTLVEDANLTLVLRHGESGDAVRVAAHDNGGGHYTATIALDRPGTWHWYVDGYGRYPMPAIDVRAAAADAGFASLDPSPGARLFVGKGCLICHANRRVTERKLSFEVGPDLTHYRRDAEFLHRWLVDPASVRPGTEMPDLGLDAAEVATLAAYFSSARTTQE